MNSTISDAVTKQLLTEAYAQPSRTAIRHAEAKKKLFVLSNGDEDHSPVEFKIRSSPRGRSATMPASPLASPKRVGPRMRLPSADQLDYHPMPNAHIASSSFAAIKDQKTINRSLIERLDFVTAIRDLSSDNHIDSALQVLTEISQPTAMEAMTCSQKLNVLVKLSSKRLDAEVREQARGVALAMLRSYLHPTPLFVCENRHEVILSSDHPLASGPTRLWQLKLFGESPVGLSSPIDTCGQTPVGFAAHPDLGFCFYKKVSTPLELLYKQDDHVSGQVDCLSDVLKSVVVGVELPIQSQPVGVIIERGRLLILHEAGHASLASLREVLPSFAPLERAQMLEHIAFSVVEQVSILSDLNVAYGILRPETLGWDRHGSIKLTHQCSRASYAAFPIPHFPAFPSDAKSFFRDFSLLDTMGDVAGFVAPERFVPRKKWRSEDNRAAYSQDLYPSTSAAVSDDLWALGITLRDTWLFALGHDRSSMVPRLKLPEITKEAGVDEEQVVWSESSDTPRRPLDAWRSQLLSYAEWHAAVSLDQFPDAATHEATLHLPKWREKTQELERLLKERRGLAYIIHQVLNHPSMDRRLDGFDVLDQLKARIAPAHPSDIFLPTNGPSQALAQLVLDDTPPRGTPRRPTAPRLRPWPQSVARLFERAADLTHPWGVWRDALLEAAAGARVIYAPPPSC